MRHPRLAPVAVAALASLGAGLALASPALAQQTAAQPAPAQPGAPAPARLGTRDVAATAQWLVGDWRGTTPRGEAFYERYRFENDSTIEQESFADSTFRTATERSTVVLRGGALALEGAGGRSRWVVVRSDSLGLHFAPERGATNEFSWAPAGRDGWRATMRFLGKDGARTVVYEMRRVTPAP